MPPSRRSRRSNNLPQAPAAASDVTYKKGDIVEFHLNGTSVTGRLVKKATSTSSDAQLWVVAPSDRRRKNETVSELDFSRYEDDANVAGTAKRKSYKSGSSQGSKGSDENSEKLKSAKSTTSSSEENSNGSGKKRKSDDNADNNKKVTFQEQRKKKISANNGSIRVGTRSTRNSNQELFDVNQQPPQLRKKNALKKIKNNENVTVVQLLTGTLYLYRGETRRAEFVRSKY